jgi:hypothetical protein
MRRLYKCPLAIITICALNAMGQAHLPNSYLNASTQRFSVVLSTYNHAEMFIKGEITYRLSNSSIQITKHFLLDKKSKVVYYKKLADPDLTYGTVVSAFGLDSLKDFYYNYCIMPTSGNEYFLNIKMGSFQKEMSLHCFYLEQLQKFIDFMNAYLPEEYQCKYLPKNTRQDCQLK